MGMRIGQGITGSDRERRSELRLEMGLGERWRWVGLED